MEPILHLSTEAVTQLFSLIFGAILISVISLGVRYISQIAKSVKELNDKMIAIGTTSKFQEETIDEIKERLSRLEARRLK